MSNRVIIVALLVVGCSGGEKQLPCPNPLGDAGVNEAPLIQGLTVEPSEGVTTSSQLVCLEDVSDPNNDAVTRQFLWTNQNDETLSEARTLELAPDIVQPDDLITCALTISDGTLSATESASVQIENSPPEISSIQINAEEAEEAIVLTCQADATDPDLETLTYTFSWTQGETEIGTESSLELDENSSDEPITCKVIIGDGFGGQATGSTEYITENRPPVIGSLDLSGLAMDESALPSLTCGSLAYGGIGRASLEEARPS